MNFASDTTAPAHPAVLAALAAANSGAAPSYGGDDAMQRVRALLEAVFETTDLDFWITASGTASNALALSCFCPPTGAILCHREAHIERDERGAPEFFTGGGKLSLLPGEGAKIDPEALAAALARNDPAFVHETPAHVLSLTNLTECGRIYTPAEVDALAGAARASGLTVHLDGARLANALVSAGASPARLTWQAGVDVLTLGLTKTGAIGCEIIVLFGGARAKISELKIRAKRSGHMPPKMRYLAAQAIAMLSDGLWLHLAEAANGHAYTLGLSFSHFGVGLAHDVDGNEVFAALSEKAARRLAEGGARFHPWPDGSYRFVCAWSTTDEEVAAFRTLLAAAVRD